jgi:nucleoid-associated protein YgaU
MGLLDFVRDAGEKIFGKEDDDKAKAQRTQKPSAAPKTGGAAKAGAPTVGAKPTPTFDELRELALRRAVEKHGLPVTGLQIQVRGERVTVSGRVPTQEQREKLVLVLGNVAGIAQVDDRLEVERKEPEAKLYTVKSGDTLSKIAKEYYGNASKYPVIFEANKPMLTNPDKIYPGQVLRIPPSV